MGVSDILTSRYPSAAISVIDQIDRILAQWQAERPDLDVGPMGTLGRISRLYRHLREEMDKVFIERGLSRASFDMLATLRRSGPPFALSPSVLIDWTMVTSGTLTNRIDRLEAAGLVSLTSRSVLGLGPHNSHR